MRLLTAFLLLTISLPAPAEEPAEVELNVKPLLCIVDKRTPSCEMTFEVRWESRESGYYCVLNDIEPLPLRCWDEARQGELEDERSVEQDFSYAVNEGGDAPPVAAVTVEVLRMDSDDRRRRRRTRHVWDLL